MFEFAVMWFAVSKIHCRAQAHAVTTYDSDDAADNNIAQSYMHVRLRVVTTLIGPLSELLSQVRVRVACVSRTYYWSVEIRENAFDK